MAISTLMIFMLNDQGQSYGITLVLEFLKEQTLLCIDLNKTNRQQTKTIFIHDIGLS